MESMNRRCVTDSPEQRLRYGDQPSELDLDVTHPPSELAIGDHIFERSTARRQYKWGLDLVKATYHRRVVTDINRVDSHWQWEFRHRLPADVSFVETLHSDSPTITTSPPPQMPDFPRSTATYRDAPDWRFTRWECRPTSPPPITASPKTLDFTELSGPLSRTIANQLLAGGPDGCFDHVLPGVQNGSGLLSRRTTELHTQSQSSHNRTIAIPRSEPVSIHSISPASATTLQHQKIPAHG